MSIINEVAEMARYKDTCKGCVDLEMDPTGTVITYECQINGAPVDNNTMKVQGGRCPQGYYSGKSINS